MSGFTPECITRVYNGALPAIATSTYNIIQND